MAEKSGSQFPPAWLWLVDEAIPSHVKRNYSPRDSWKSKPFTKEDAIFFTRGIQELSDLFTDERPKRMPAYFQHAKFRSGYLLYFLPLQAAKFLTIFETHPAAIEAMLAHGRKTGALRIADLGAGPGTASLALLLKLLSVKLAAGEELPPVEMDWVDTNLATMEDGKQLAEAIAAHFPRLRGKLTIRLHAGTWWEAPRLLQADTSLILMGHVLNEAGGPSISQDQGPSEAWTRLWGSLARDRAKGGGVLMVEPAARVPSQHLSQLRNQLFDSELLPRTAQSVWGPCLHAEKCPLSDGRDWCHFSVPVNIPGEWFRGFSRALGSERQWVKFSYVWLASLDAPSPLPDPRIRRVISDPLTTERGKASGPKSVLLCEPEAPGRLTVRADQLLWRGDLVPAGGGRAVGGMGGRTTGPSVTPRDERGSRAGGPADEGPRKKKSRPGKKERAWKKAAGAAKGPESWDGERKSGGGAKPRGPKRGPRD